MARGDRLGVPDYVQIPAYWAGIWVAAVISLLLATSKWWWRWANVAPQAASESGLRPGRKSLVAILFILAIGTFLRAPAMDRLILRDEQDNLRRSIHGFHEIDRRWTSRPARRFSGWMPRSSGPFQRSVGKPPGRVAPSACSGGMYAGVPRIWPVPVRLLSASVFFASPKSVTFGCPFRSIMVNRKAKIS